MSGVPLYAGNLRAVILVSLLIAQKVWDDKWYYLLTFCINRLNSHSWLNCVALASAFARFLEPRDAFMVDSLRSR